MKILIVCATLNEGNHILETLQPAKCLEENFFRGYAVHLLIDLQITGVGASATAEKLALRLLHSHYDLVLNIGICGSYKKTLPPGTVVNIIAEEWGDLGAEDRGEFLDLFDLGILRTNETPFSGKRLINPGNKYSDYFSHLPGVNGLTVNTVHGREESIEACLRKYNPDVESMEGMAIFSYCLSRGINFQCLRSISNFVVPRNRSAWEIEPALRNLTTEVNRILSAIGK